MKTLNAPELQRLLDQVDPLLLNVLDHDEFEKAHIPGSLNVPISHENFVREVERLAGGVNRPVVVYCSSEECQASPRAGRELLEAGFKNVWHFRGGMAEWKLAQLPIESGEPAKMK